ncbi:sigma-70 family RNA polymerase sigma factor [Nocardioides sp. IC4_145]|uniref:sigma-70 family RNA polymerase sigma factor n=1 Tax=Nocardioides sp. IC4_145 TaxID=2714037 RepID=UPI00140E3569|nr:sigma-70 family RNA polymerase sigma factor [Nocardioides sp. IC4_145]
MTRQERKAGEADDRDLLRAALAALPPRQRAVIVLRYYEDLTERQTAEALGIAVGTVKSGAGRSGPVADARAGGRGGGHYRVTHDRGVQHQPDHR